MRPSTIRTLMPTLVFLLFTTPAAACPPSGDLWFVSKNSDRVLVVDVESVRRTVPNSFLHFASWALGEVGRIAEAIEPGLGMVLYDHLPDIDLPMTVPRTLRESHSRR